MISLSSCPFSMIGLRLTSRQHGRLGWFMRVGGWESSWAKLVSGCSKPSPNADSASLIIRGDEYWTGHEEKEEALKKRWKKDTTEVDAGGAHLGQTVGQKILGGCQLGVLFNLQLVSTVSQLRVNWVCCSTYNLVAREHQSLWIWQLVGLWMGKKKCMQR